ncbi:MAG: serine/threonine-protein kinase [Elusimicrobiota bacterium]
MNDSEFIGSIFAGCKIVSKIGQGGMGSVYKAEHLALGKTVCVKLLSKELSFDQRNIEFFMREARSASKLDHPNIVHVYSFGEEKGLYFIVMSYVEGKTLEDILKEKGRMTIPEAAEYVIGILEGLAHAHSKNIIHRDIKPSNILVTSEGTPRIADFGLARSVNEEKQLTIAGEMVGTAYFMSPEQGLAAKVDTRADLYAVGATFFYLITGRYPYDGKTSIEVISKHINEPLPNLYQIMPDIPIWTAKVIEKLMKKNPEERYQKAQEALEEIKKHKEAGYADNLSQNDNEKTYDLEDLKKSAQTKKEENGQSVINRQRYDDFSVEKEQSSRGLSQKKEEPPQIFDPKKAKFQLGSIYKITKFVYHLGLLFAAGIFSMLSGTYASLNFSYSGNLMSDLFSAVLKNPVYILSSLTLALISAFLSSKTKPFKTTPGHFLLSMIFCFSLFSGAAALAYPQSQDIFSRLFINITYSFYAGFQKPNLWLISLSALIFYLKVKNAKSLTLRFLSASFLAAGVILFFTFSQWACDAANNPPISEKNLIYASVGLSAAAVLLAAAGKSFLIIFTPFIFYLSALPPIFIHNFNGLSERFYSEILKADEERYSREMEIYNLRNSVSEYEETGEYDSEGRPIVKQKPKEQISAPMKKSDGELRKESSDKAAQALIKRAKNQAIKTGALLFFGFILFLYLNAMYWEETIFYEKNYLQV